MELVILGLIIGLGISYLISQRFSLSKKKNLVEKQSVILLDKIKKVSNRITDCFSTKFFRKTICYSVR